MGFAGDLRSEIGSKKCTGGGGHLRRIGTMSTEVEGLLPVHVFCQIWPELYKGGGPHLPPPIGGGDHKVLQMFSAPRLVLKNISVRCVLV